MKSKSDAKALGLQKRKRRQWITFMRMVRYGINNFSRNAWLTIAATAVMTITLLIVFSTLVARNTLVTTVEDLKSKLDISIYLDRDTPDDAIETIKNDITKLESVDSVSYITPEEARKAFAQQRSQSPETLSALNEAINRFPGTVRVNLVDINDTDELRAYVNTNELLKKYIDEDREPSFAGPRKAAIENLGRSIDFADRAGLSASIVFIVISSLIVFNTIRMAIFNRKEEIQMMKLIGADKNFIRGPFIVEAVFYGFIAAIFASAIGIGALHASAERLKSYVDVGPTLSFIFMYLPLVVISMIVLGALIGVLSSLLATRRYLKL